MRSSFAAFKTFRIYGADFLYLDFYFAMYGVRASVL